MIDTLETYLQGKENRARKQLGRVTSAMEGAIKMFEDDPNTWARGTYGLHLSCSCWVGACVKADVAGGYQPAVSKADAHFADIRTIEALTVEAAIKSGAINPYSTIAEFNDAHDFGTVLRAMKKTLRYAKKHGL